MPSGLSPGFFSRETELLEHDQEPPIIPLLHTSTIQTWRLSSPTYPIPDSDLVLDTPNSFPWTIQCISGLRQGPLLTSMPVHSSLHEGQSSASLEERATPHLCASTHSCLRDGQSSTSPGTHTASGHLCACIHSPLPDGQSSACIGAERASPPVPLRTVLCLPWTLHPSSSRHGSLPTSVPLFTVLSLMDTPGHLHEHKGPLPSSVLVIILLSVMDSLAHLKLQKVPLPTSVPVLAVLSLPWTVQQSPGAHRASP